MTVGRAPSNNANVSEAPFQLVVGKGGVGKSTVAAALGHAAADAGHRTLVAELGRPAGVARALGVDAGKAGEPQEVSPGLWFLWVDGETALSEYLALVVPVRRLLAAVLSSRLYRYFVAAAPGLKELMTIGKLWYEHQRTDAAGAGRLWDRIIVDAGASGHALQYLRMPATAARTFQAGLVHRESERVAKHLRDPETTRVHVVALPESMPLVEAAEIIEQLTGELGIALGEIFVNRCRPVAPRGAEAALRSISAAAEPMGERLSVLVGVAERTLGWSLLQEREIAAFEARTQRQIRRLPMLVTEEFGQNEIAVLARELDGSERHS